MTPRIGTVALGSTPRIVAAGGEAEVAALARAHEADLVELRADLFDDPSPDRIRAALEALRGGGRPVILTVRHASEGGRAMPESTRRALYEATWGLADAIDLEIASTELVDALVPHAKRDGVVVILSTHAMTTTPPAATLGARVEEAMARGADIAKLATFTRTIDDVRTLLAATLAHQTVGIATMGMGTYAAITRVATFAAGSLFTYASVGAPTAPGQLAVHELRSLLDRLYPG